MIIIIIIIVIIIMAISFIMRIFLISNFNITS